jgi:hypothetical protein
MSEMSDVTRANRATRSSSLPQAGYRPMGRRRVGWACHRAHDAQRMRARVDLSVDL